MPDEPDSFISTHPNRMSGKPCLRGTRVTVAQLIAEVSEGRSVPKLAEDMDLSAEDLAGMFMEVAGKYDMARPDELDVATLDEIERLMAMLVDDLTSCHVGHHSMCHGGRAHGGSCGCGASDAEDAMANAVKFLRNAAPALLAAARTRAMQTDINRQLIAGVEKLKQERDQASSLVPLAEWQRLFGVETLDAIQAKYNAALARIQQLESIDIDALADKCWVVSDDYPETIADVLRAALAATEVK